MVKANYDKLREKGAKKKKLSQASAKKQKALRISKVEVHAKMEHNKAIANMKEQMQKNTKRALMQKASLAKYSKERIAKAFATSAYAQLKLHGLKNESISNGMLAKEIDIKAIKNLNIARKKNKELLAKAREAAQKAPKYVKGVGQEMINKAKEAIDQKMAAMKRELERQAAREQQNIDTNIVHTKKLARLLITSAKVSASTVADEAINIKKGAEKNAAITSKQTNLQITKDKRAFLNVALKMKRKYALALRKALQAVATAKARRAGVIDAASMLAEDAVLFAAKKQSAIQQAMRLSRRARNLAEKLQAAITAGDKNVPHLRSQLVTCQFQIQKAEAAIVRVKALQVQDLESARSALNGPVVAVTPVHPIQHLMSALERSIAGGSQKPDP